MNIKSAPLGSMGANFYLVCDEDTKDIFVVDPGDESDIAIEMIKEASGNLKYIILTHAHVDHIGALDDIKNEFDAKIVICNEEEKALNNGDINLCSAFGEASPISKADILVSDGDALPFGKSEIKFLHTPGHTKGSMCILAEGALFSGDTIFRLSVGRCDFPGGSFDELQSSIKSKIYTLPDDTMIYPGHNSPTTVGYEKENNPFVRK